MTSNGYNVMGWQADAATQTIRKDTVSALRVMSPENQNADPEPTKQAYFKGIIDKNSTQLTSESGLVTSISFYDNLGYSYVAKYAVKQVTVDDTSKPVMVTQTQTSTDPETGEETTTTTEVQKTDANGNLVYEQKAVPGLFSLEIADIVDSATNKSLIDTDSDGQISDAEKANIKNYYTFAGATEPDGNGTRVYLHYDTGTSGADSGKFLGFSTTQNGTVGDPKDKLTMSAGNAINALEDFEVALDTTTMWDNNQTSTLAGKPGDYDGNYMGRKVGKMSGLSVDQSGKIYASYDNGTQRILGQIAVAQFENPSGLEKIGENLYATTMNSGEFDGIGMDVTSDGVGKLTAGVLEMSNVDLSAEFTDMITTQRGFQANSRIITVSDSMLEELTNLKR